MGDKEETDKMSKKSFNTKTLTKCAILSAAAWILMLFEFPLPVAPVFYKADFSEVAVLIGAFSMGPWAGVVIEGIKIVLNVLTTGTSTAYVGELANFIIGCAFVLPAAWIYHHNKTRKNAIIGLAAGTVLMALVGCVVNYFVLIPMYSTLYGLPLDAIIDMGRVIFPIIHDTFTFVCFAVMPFNLIKGIGVSVVTTLLYKHVSPILHA